MYLKCKTGCLDFAGAGIVPRSMILTLEEVSELAQARLCSVFEGPSDYRARLCNVCENPSDSRARLCSVLERPSGSRARLCTVLLNFLVGLPMQIVRLRCKLLMEVISRGIMETNMAIKQNID